MDKENKIIKELEQRIVNKEAKNYKSLADNKLAISALVQIKAYCLNYNETSWKDGIEKINRLLNKYEEEDKSIINNLLYRLKVSIAEKNKAMQTNPENVVDIVVISALYEPELLSFLNNLNEYDEKTLSILGSNSTISYYLSEINVLNTQNQLEPKKIACLFHDNMGLTDASISVVNAIYSFNPKLVVMIGVCAGRSKMKVKITDLIFPSQVITYDTGKYADGEFQHEPYWSEVDNNIIRKATTAGKEIIQNLASDIKKNTPKNFYTPNIHFDTMACGSSVVDRIGMVDEIAGINRKIVGIDMESYAVLRSIKLTNSNIKTFVVKGVMDLSDKKSDSYKDQAAFWSANFAYKFIETQFNSIL